MKGLRISPSLTLPIETVTGTHAILGRKRTGKTYKAKVMAEEMLRAKQQIIVIDPTDAWWGLRSSSDGASEGYPITIFGGRHSDLPLDPAAAVDLARAVIHDRFSAIFALKGMSNAAEQRFCAAFLETLYTDNDQRPIHIFMDEADIYAPQMPQGEEMRTLGATKKIVRRGGLDGLGITLISQRSADLAKSVLTQCDTLIALALSHPADLKPVSDWVKVQVKNLALAKDMMEELPELARGDAWVWSPHHDIRVRATFRDLETFDSSRSPKPGETQKPPKVLSKVDIARLGERIAQTIERAKESDPKLLRQQVVELKAQLSKAVYQSSAAHVIKPAAPERIDPAQIQRIEKLTTRIHHEHDRLHIAISKLDAERDRLAQAQQAMVSELDNLTHAVKLATAPVVSPQTGRQATAQHEPVAARPRDSVAGAGYERRVSGVAAGETAPTGNGHRRTAVPATDAAGEPIELGKADLAVLGAFVWLDQLGQSGPHDRNTIGVLAGYSVTSGHYANILGKLRTAGLVEYPSGGTVALTDLGRRTAPEGRSIPSLAELHTMVKSKLTPSHAQILHVLMEEYPDPLERAQIAERSNLSATSGHFANLLGRLRTLGLVEYPQPNSARAADLLYPRGLR